MDTIQIGDVKITWLQGGIMHLDGGTMFGVVPKVLWEKKYPCNEKNQVQLRTDPILIQVEGKNILVESGIGKGKLNEKQLRNFGVIKESEVENSLKELGLSTADIDYVCMTHLHYDHASGLTKWDGDTLISQFENAVVLTTEKEWEEMRNPNIRSVNTYWEENWKPIQSQVKTYKEEYEIIPGVKMVHSGGHSDGHAVLSIDRGGEKIIHMADIMPTTAHQNVLWVLAFDDYPMDSISAKQKWMKEGLAANAWYIFYHDAYHRAIKWDSNGEVLDSLKVGE